MEWLTLLAIFLGPIAAVQAQKWIERATEKRRERLLLFKTLMRTRGNVMNPEHVAALNMISIEFAGKNQADVNVRRKWEIYLNHLNLPFPIDQGKEIQAAYFTERLKRLTDLLVTLSQALGFKFDEEDIRRVYAPIGYQQESEANQEVRRLLLDWLRGKSSVKIAPNHPASTPQGQPHNNEVQSPVSPN